MSWAVPSDCGFSSTGFMSVAGGTPQARACNACARPISPPSSVTAALFDMFCGLNGRTRKPRRVNARARPATSSDLPTSEPVPCSIKARVICPCSSEFDPGLRLDAGAVLGVPGEPLPHGAAGDEIGEAGEHGALAGAPGPLDELHDTDPHAVAEAAQYHAESGGRFTLAGTGVDDQQAAFLGLGRQHFAARR